MKRLINARPSLICVVSVVLGILSFYNLIFGEFWLLIVSCALPLVLCVVFAILKNRKWMLFLTALIFVGLGFALTFGVYRDRQEYENFSKQCVITGRITDLGRNGQRGNVLYLENCVVENTPLKGCVAVYVYEGTEFEAGEILTAKGTLNRVYALKDSVDSFSVRDNVRYQLSNVKIYDRLQGELTWDESVRKYLFDVTDGFMEYCGGIAYALVTGDRNAMSSNVYQDFKLAGIVHLLVVSGLHVGFLTAIFGVLLKRLKLNPLLQFVILAVPLFLYAAICNFSPSILRAILMTACLYLSRFLFGKYDLFSSLCWAATIILLVQPLYLFDSGFQLSVLSVLGICTIYLQIDRILRRKKIPKALRWVLNSVVLSFSCVAATFFVSALCFSEISFAGIVTNIVAVPLVFVSFVLTLVSLLPWVFHYVAWASDKILLAVVLLAHEIAKLDLTVQLDTVKVAVVVSVALLLVVGGFVNLKRWGKVAASAVCAVVLAVMSVVAVLPVQCKNCVRVFTGYSDTVVVATSQNGEVAVVGNLDDAYAFNSAWSFIDSRKAQSVSVYLTEFVEANDLFIYRLCENKNVQAVYALDFSSNATLEAYFKQNGVQFAYVYPNSTVGKDVKVQAAYDGGLVAAVVKVGGISVADVLCKGVHAENFAKSRHDIDYYLVRDSARPFADRGLFTLSQFQQEVFGNFGANRYGNFTISEKDGTILLNFRRREI